MSQNEVKRQLSIENYEAQLKAYEAVGVEPDYATSHLVSDLKNSISYKNDLLEALSFSEKRSAELEGKTTTLENEVGKLEGEVGKLEKRTMSLAVAVVVALIALAGVTLFFFKQTNDLKKQLSTINQGAKMDDISDGLSMLEYNEATYIITIDEQGYYMEEMV